METAFLTMRALYFTFLFLVTMVVIGCGGGSDGEGRTDVVIFAAVSLTTQFEALSEAFTTVHPEIRWVCSFASSRLLQEQIAQGAGCDIFVSASPVPMDALADAGLIRGETRRPLLYNALVLAGPSGPATPVVNDDYPPVDFAFWRPLRRIGLAQAGVPAGDYAYDVLGNLNLLERLGSRLIPLLDEQVVMATVASGNVDAGFVYASTLAAGRSRNRLQLLWEPDRTLYPMVTYPIAVTRDALQPEAARTVVAWLTSADAAPFLRAGGFRPAVEE